jgi:Domain of unknown function (DUF5666)
MITRRGAIMGILACIAVLGTARAQNPCALSSGGMGGTGAPAAVAREDPGGIGGTGVFADEGGIGGTGITGVITGFASICVAGIEVHYAANTPVQHEGRLIPITDLKVGHVVQVEARGVGASVHARTIRLEHVVTGPVTRIDARAGTLEVLGQVVRVPLEFVAHAQEAQRNAHPVLVSGLRNAAGDIVATRIEAAPGLREFGVSGSLQGLSGTAAKVGNLSVKLEPAAGRALKSGQTVRVRGTLDKGVLRARSLDSEPAFRGPVDTMVVEGFIGERKLNLVRVGDTLIRVDAKTSIGGGSASEMKRDRRVVVTARVGDGKLVAERLEFVREQQRDARPDTHGGGKDPGKDGSDRDVKGGEESSGGESHSTEEKDQAGKGLKGGSQPRDSTKDSDRPEKDRKSDRSSGSSHGARPERIRPERIRPERIRDDR